MEDVPETLQNILYKPTFIWEAPCLGNILKKRFFNFKTSSAVVKKT
jgi:hypothetical protein